jgi:hypothetical protein
MLALPVVVVASFAGGDAVAIERTCQAKWELIRQDTGGVHAMEVFEAKGTCGSTVPNRCRKRARAGAQECMKTHWAQRWTPQDGPWTRPGVCTSGNKIFGYHVGNIKCRVERKIRDLQWCGKRVRLMRVTHGPTDHCDSRENVGLYMTDDSCSTVARTCSLGADPVEPQ